MRVYCQMLDQPETLRELTVENLQTASDDYVRKYVQCIRGVSFIEVSRDRNSWSLWRCECYPSLFFAVLNSEPVTRDAAYAEISSKEN